MYLIPNQGETVLDRIRSVSLGGIQSVSLGEMQSVCLGGIQSVSQYM